MTGKREKAAMAMRWLWLAAALGHTSSISMPRLIEAKLAKHAVPLVVSVDAAEDLRLRGVARINAVLPAAQCAALRLHVGALAKRSLDPETAKWAAWMDPDVLGRYVPGTRLRFADTLEQQLESKHRRDILLPLEDAVVRDALGIAVGTTRATLEKGAAACLAGAGEGALELVECGVLASTFGAGHQRLHADFHRDGAGLRADERGAMPPRLVCFVYLQDTPTVAHGPTGFLPGTATAEAHAATVAPDGSIIAEALAGAVAEVATVAAGDAVLYDASVLHWGASNRTPANERAIFYFGVAAAGAAAKCAGPPADGAKPVPPVWLADL